MSKIRVLIAKPGLDGHAEAIVATAIQEDVDAIGLSILSGAHNTVFPRIIELLKEKGASDIVVFGGGVIPETDIPGLLEAGVAHIFTPGTPTEETVKFLAEKVTPKNRA